MMASMGMDEMMFSLRSIAARNAATTAAREEPPTLADAVAGGGGGGWLLEFEEDENWRRNADATDVNESIWDWKADVASLSRVDAVVVGFAAVVVPAPPGGGGCCSTNRSVTEEESEEMLNPWPCSAPG